MKKSNTVQYHGVGRRKKSVARVFLRPGTGNIVVNGKTLEEYLPLETLRMVVKSPLEITNTADQFDVIINVQGGGYTGQSGAMRHGITRALMEAAIEVHEEEGYDIVPEIMIPLVGEVKELKYVKDIVVETAELVKKEKGSDMEYHIGTMIEIPRAALTADAIATEAEFFSFGTNDLTQMTFGFSRDDAGKFLGAYYEKKIYEQDPFARLDQVGVGQLVKMAAEKGKATRPNIKLGICGEHGGDPSSVEFCHNIGLTYVSCSPYRVPIARLAAAQAAIKASK